MSQTEVLMRHSIIINRLEKGAATLKELLGELALQADLQEYKLVVSSKTISRDIQQILAIHKREIEYNTKTKKYHLHTTEDADLSSRILDAFDTLNALNSSVGYSNYIDLEKRKSGGSNNFHGILHAIKNRKQIIIGYQSYWENDASIKTLEPYLLKEFKNRWYIIAKDVSKSELRTYGLDRITEFDISKKTFKYPASFVPKEHFKNSFGIIKNDSNKPVQDVVLKFSQHQGKYVKSLPLHHSQQIISDTADGLTIKLNIYVTFDLEMELLSYGAELEVLEPEFLRKSIKRKLKETLSRYS